MKVLNLKNKLISISLLLSTAILSQSAIAGTASHGIDKIQSKQKIRIMNGVTSGSLTSSEAKKLRKQQANIRVKERHFKADGRFTHRERKIIRQDLKKASKRIYKLKHNRQARLYRQGFQNSQGGYYWNKPAHTHKPRVNINNQKRRIKQGLISGSLTVREAAKLGLQHANIRDQERRFKADGIYTKRERRIINNRLKRASKNIYRKKHNWSHQ